MEGFAIARNTPEREMCCEWSTLRATIEASVRECAAVAGERLWSVNSCAGTESQFRICSAWDVSDYVELSLDDDLRRIVCRFGPAVSKPELYFEIEDGTLRYGGSRLPVTAAASFVLDQLIFPDE